MRDRVSRRLGTKYLAETDGILHGFIECKGDGDRGTLSLYTDAGTKDVVAYAAASAHRNSATSKHGRAGSVMLPVPKGANYMARLVHRTPGSFEASASVFWTPIVPSTTATGTPRPAIAGKRH
jgi:hypothetical protein